MTKLKDDKEYLEAMEILEAENQKSEIMKLLEGNDFEGNGAEIQCPGCEKFIEIFCHVLDEELCIARCDCGHEESISDGLAHNPNRCQGCNELVLADEDSVECNAKDDEGRSNCSQKAHEGCVEYCSSCGYLCEDETSNYIECTSCGLLHDSDHFTSFGSDFVDTFGLICNDCFYDDEDTNEQEHEEIGDENELKKSIALDLLGGEVQKVGINSERVKLNYTQLPQRKREDQSPYLSHFVRKKDVMTDEDCFNQLVKIIKEKKLEARPTGYFSTYSASPEKTLISKAVCFTEGRIMALKDHALQYSPFGIAISKYNLMSNFKCAPAIYIHDDIISSVRESIPLEMVPYVNKISCKGYDYHHEREWRAPCDVDFEHKEIHFLFAPKNFHARLLAELEAERPIYCITSIIDL